MRIWWYCPIFGGLDCAGSTLQHVWEIPEWIAGKSRHHQLLQYKKAIISKVQRKHSKTYLFRTPTIIYFSQHFSTLFFPCIITNQLPRWLLGPSQDTDRHNDFMLPCRITGTDSQVTNGISNKVRMDGSCVVAIDDLQRFSESFFSVEGIGFCWFSTQSIAMFT